MIRLMVIFTNLSSNPAAVVMDAIAFVHSIQRKDRRSYLSLLEVLVINLTLNRRFIVLAEELITHIQREGDDLRAARLSRWFLQFKAPPAAKSSMKRLLSRVVTARMGPRSKTVGAVELARIFSQFASMGRLNEARSAGIALLERLLVQAGTAREFEGVLIALVSMTARKATIDAIRAIAVRDLVDSVRFRSEEVLRDLNVKAR